jgi:Raf kinase inhibitor-like YbhB/YbcL family protein
VSPVLTWQGAPQVTKEFALICDDPDAPTREPWVHWLIYNLPPETQALPEHVSQAEQLEKPVSGTQGCNSWSSGENLGYRGPMPPRGHGVHHYHFKLYALDTALKLPPSIDKQRLVSAMEGHVVATTELVGTYERK